MHQTWRFKRINGTAYPESIASILRDAFGGECRCGTGRPQPPSAAAESAFPEGACIPPIDKSWLPT